MCCTVHSTCQAAHERLLTACCDSGSFPGGPQQQQQQESLCGVMKPGDQREGFGTMLTKAHSLWSAATPHSSGTYCLPRLCFEWHLLPPTPKETNIVKYSRADCYGHSNDAEPSALFDLVGHRSPIMSSTAKHRNAAAGQ